MCKWFAILATAVVLGSDASTAFSQCCCGCVSMTDSPVVNWPTASGPVGTFAVPAPRVVQYAPAAPYSAMRVTPGARVVAYAPAVHPVVAYYGVAGTSIFGTPKVYVHGEPVRNVLRAITP